MLKGQRRTGSAWWFSVLAVGAILIVGCATSVAVSTEVVEEEPVLLEPTATPTAEPTAGAETAPAETPALPEPPPKRDVWLAVERVTKLPDGSIDSTVTIRYDPARDVPLEERKINGRGQVIETVTLVYDAAGLLTARETRDGAGKLTTALRYTYGGARVATEILNDGSGAQQTRSDYTHDAQGRAATWAGFGSKGEALGTVQYRYDDAGRLVEATSKGPAGNVDGYTVYEYDVEGNVLSEKTLDATRAVVRETRRLWTDGHLTEETTLLGGSVRRVAVYENDPHGNAVRITRRDGSGRVLDTTELKYELRQR